jgi:uncharacterized protein (TIGR00375 family)
MKQAIIDLHIHSKYARACSKDLELPKIAKTCEEKGIDIVATGDFTHPAWFKSIETELEEVGNTGFLVLKNGSSRTKFVIGTEISCIYKHKEKVRRLHILVFAPGLETARRFIAALEERGANLRSDGRPIMGLSGKEVVKLCKEIDPRMIVVPAHAWTPWFAVFGSKSGYDSLEECFEELTPEIFAIETGLSSDPPMNRRLTALDNISLISNSDAHSLPNIGREANVLLFKDENEMIYDRMWQIIRSGNPKEFLYTIEFYPEEGMYHFDGHRTCEVSLSPKETKKEKEICPKCKKKLTVGVLHRVEHLADRTEEQVPNSFVPHRYVVPLREVIARTFDVGVGSKRVEAEYRSLLKNLGTEFNILLHLDSKDIKAATVDPNIASAIENMRAGQVKIVPGYDGVYGTVDLFPTVKMKRPRQAALI